MNIEAAILKLQRCRTVHAEFAKLEKDAAAAKRAAEMEVVDAMAEAGVTSAKSSEVSVTATVHRVPAEIDWPKVYDFIHEKRQFDLLQKRLSTTVLKQLDDAGEPVPGVGMQDITKLSVRKARSA